MTEKIVIDGNQKKSLNKFATLMGNLGFTKISYLRDNLTVERVIGFNLEGKPELDYRMTFQPGGVILEYEVKKNKKAKLMRILPVFLNVLQLAEDYYDIRPSAIYFEINQALGEAIKLVGKDAIDLSTELSEMQARHRSLSAKYDDLLKSSEENARILLECERKRDELNRKVDRLVRYSDDVMKEMVYEWINLHNGKINILEFSKINRIAVPRVEEVLNMLVTEGYIKRRFD